MGEYRRLAALLCMASALRRKALTLGGSGPCIPFRRTTGDSLAVFPCTRMRLGCCDPASSSRAAYRNPPAFFARRMDSVHGRSTGYTPCYGRLTNVAADKHFSDGGFSPKGGGGVWLVIKRRCEIQRLFFFS